MRGARSQSLFVAPPPTMQLDPVPVFWETARGWLDSPVIGARHPDLNRPAPPDPGFAVYVQLAPTSLSVGAVCRPVNETDERINPFRGGQIWPEYQGIVYVREFFPG